MTSRAAPSAPTTAVGPFPQHCCPPPPLPSGPSPCPAALPQHCCPPPAAKKGAAAFGLSHPHFCGLSDLQSDCTQPVTPQDAPSLWADALAWESFLSAPSNTMLSEASVWGGHSGQREWGPGRWRGGQLSSPETNAHARAYFSVPPAPSAGHALGWCQGPAALCWQPLQGKWLSLSPAEPLPAARMYL